MDDKDLNRIQEIFSDYEMVIARMILFCLKEMPIPQGVRRTIDILKGTRSSFVVSNEFNKLQTFSSLVGFTRDQLSDLLDVLITHGYIEVIDGYSNDEKVPLLKISQKGILYLENPQNADFMLQHILTDKDAPQIPEEDQDLYYKLKLTRRQLAEEYDIPAFMVCTDKVLRDICLQKPTESHQLKRISEIGPQFMELYSRQFLYVMRQYLTREK